MPTAMYSFLKAVLLGFFSVKPVLGAEFHVKVVVQNSLVSASLIDKAVQRRVNSNWRLLGGHRMTYSLVQGTDCLLTAASACSAGTPVTAVFGVGSCCLLKQLNELANSMSVPFIGVPSGLCSSDTASGLGLIGSQQTEEFVGAVKAALVSTGARDAVILFDQHQDVGTVEQLQLGLTGGGIGSFNLLVRNESLQQQLDRLSQTVRTRHIVALLSPEELRQVLDAAASTAPSMLQQHYFWLIVDTGLTPAELLASPAARPNVNLLLVRGGTFGGGVGGNCPSAAMDVFEDCLPTGIKTLEVRTVDAIESLGVALTRLLLLGNNSLPSNASCSLATGGTTAWTAGGGLLFKELVGIENYASPFGPISYNATTRHFDSRLGVEYFATYNLRRDTPLHFVHSGRFDSRSTGVGLTDLFRLRGRPVVFPNTFTGFKNDTLLLCTMDFEPFVKITKVYPNNSVEISGMVFELLEYLKEKMEFNYILKQSDDGLWGNVEAGKAFASGCIGEVQNQSVVFGATTFTKSASRSRVVDFSYTLFEDAFTMLLPRPAPASKLWNIFAPLRPETWLALLGALALASLSIFCLAYFSPFSAWNLQLEFAIADEIWLQEYIWSCIGSFLQQGQDFYPFAMSARAIMVSWWIFTVIVYGAYTGDLTSALTVSVSSLRIQSFEDMLNDGSLTPIMPRGTTIHNVFLSAQSGVYKQIADKMLLADTIPDCSRAVFERGFVCLSDYTYLFNVANQNCAKVYMAKERANVAPCGFAYPKNAYFAELMDLHLRNLDVTGANSRLFNKYFAADSADKACTVGLSTEADSISMEGVGGALIVTGAFYVTGILILLCELVWTRVLNRSILGCVFY